VKRAPSLVMVLEQRAPHATGQGVRVRVRVRVRAGVGVRVRVKVRVRVTVGDRVRVGDRVGVGVRDRVRSSSCAAVRGSQLLHDARLPRPAVVVVVSEADAVVALT